MNFMVNSIKKGEKILSVNVSPPPSALQINWTWKYMPQNIPIYYLGLF